MADFSYVKNDTKKSATFSNHANGNEILADLNYQREIEGNASCDVTLLAGEKRFPAHKCVLIAASDYFRSMFSGKHFVESSSKEFKLQGVTADALDVILDMIYTSVLNLNLENIHTVLATADHLLLNKTKNVCVRYLTHLLKTKEDSDGQEEPWPKYHALRIWRTAEMYNMREVKVLAEKMVGKYFKIIITTDDFEEMELGEVKELLASDYPQDNDEFIIWAAACGWLEYDIDNWETNTDALMSIIRFPLINPKILVRGINEHPLMGTEKCQEYIQEALGYQVIDWERFLEQTTRTKPRCTEDNTLIYCLAGITQFLLYIPNKDRWYCLQAPFTFSEAFLGAVPPEDHPEISASQESQSTNQRKERKHDIVYGILTVKGKVFIKLHNKEPDQYVLKRLRMYTISTNTWSDCKLPEHTSNALLIECDGILYNCSGRGVESYDPLNDIWDLKKSGSLQPCYFAASDRKQIFLYSPTGGIDIIHTDKNCQLRRLRFGVDLYYGIDHVSKLNGPEVFITSQLDKDPTSISREIGCLHSESRRYAGKLIDENWHDGLVQGSPGQGYPECLSQSDPWVTVFDRNNNVLFVLGKHSFIKDCPKATFNSRTDGILPFFKVNNGIWTRQAGLPEALLSQGGNAQNILRMAISDGRTSMATIFP